MYMTWLNRPSYDPCEEESLDFGYRMEEEKEVLTIIDSS